jgi:hypothetical protein
MQNVDNYHIEGTMRLQNNLLIAKERFGTNFNCKIVNTKWFNNHPANVPSGWRDKDVPTLVCVEDEEIILGKPRFPENFNQNEYMVELVNTHPQNPFLYTKIIYE